MSYPCLYLGAPFLKVIWGASVTSIALLTDVPGGDEEGFRKVLVVEVAGTEKGAAYASLLRSLLDQGLKGARLAVSDDHEGIKAALFGARSPGWTGNGAWRTSSATSSRTCRRTR